MALNPKYSELFERHIWVPYPKWPVGRSSKVLAHEKYLIVKRQLVLTPEDHYAIERDILDRIANCETWQKGNQFGPPACQKYIRQMIWNEPYKRIDRKKYATGGTGGKIATDEENKRAYVRDCLKRGWPVPDDHRQYIGELH